jgi:hypothetical protein
MCVELVCSRLVGDAINVSCIGILRTENVSSQFLSVFDQT